MATKTVNDIVDIKTWTYEYLLTECNRRLMSALFTGGGAAMRTEMAHVVNIVDQWLEHNRRKL